MSIFESYYTPDPPLFGPDYSVTVSYIDSRGWFYIQDEERTKRMDLIEKLLNSQSNFLPLTDELIRIGDHIACVVYDPKMGRNVRGNIRKIIDDSSGTIW